MAPTPRADSRTPSSIPEGGAVSTPKSGNHVRSTRRRVTVALVVLLVVAAAGVTWIVRSGGPTTPDSSYRVAEVGAGDVTETVALNGTVTAVKHAEVNSPIAGSISAVLVAAGQTVVAGAPLATLESSTLQATVNQAQATYELALEKIADDQAALAASKTTTTSTTTTSTTTTTQPAPSTTARPATTPGGPTPGGPPTTTTVGAPAVPTSPETTAVGSSRQGGTGRASTTPSKVGQTSGAAPTGAATASGASGASPTRTPTEADIQSDIAASYTAQIELSAAQEALARSILTSPISGVVVKVTAQDGDQVAAGTTATSSAATTAATSTSSSTALFVVEDQSGYSVVGTLPATSIGQVHEGDPATVSVATSTTDLVGAVTSVDRVPTTTSGSAVFTVTVGINSTGTPLYNGINAKATIVAEHHAAVMVVPTSAVHSSAGVATVYVAVGAQQETRIVTVGAVGLTTTEITGGLNFGDRVVLADLSAAIPTTTTPTNGTNGGLGNNGFNGNGINRRALRGN